MKSLESNPPRILIADDQADVREALRLLLKGEGFRAETVHSPAEVLAAIEQREFDAVLIDMITPASFGKLSPASLVRAMEVYQPVASY